MQMKLALIVASLSIVITINAQTNIFPNSGNVGIGTTNPQNALDINGSLNLCGGGLNSPPSSLSYGVFSHANVGIGLFSAHGGISFWGGSTRTEYMRIINGDVGIGTTTPKAKLDIGDGTANTLKSVLARLYEGGETGEGTYLGVKSYDTQLATGEHWTGGLKSFSIEHKFY